MSPFLRHGDTYEGRLSSRILAESEASVAVLVTVDNWSKWGLAEPQLDMQCGRMVANEARKDRGLPELVKPGYSEMILFEKNVSLKL